MKKGSFKYIISILILLVLAAIIRIFVGEPCKVAQNSMEPTILINDWLWINKANYGALLPEKVSDIPILNVITWLPRFQKKSKNSVCGYHRVKGYEIPKVNDIVVFKNPENRETLLIKRISDILNKGSVINLDTSNFHFFRDVINQEAKIEYLNNQIFINEEINSVYQLKNTYYFLLGDNYSVSRDSRHFGYVSEKNIVGKVNITLFSTENKQRFLKKIE